MSSTTAQPTATPVQPKITIKYLADLVQGIKTNGFFSQVVDGKQFPPITGSYVYKHSVRGEDVKDVDVLCPCVSSLSNLLQKLDPFAYRQYDRSGYDEYSYIDYSKVLFRGSDLHIDLFGIDEFVAKINSTGLSPVNSLVLTKDGVKHILEVPQLSAGLNMKSDGPLAEREWMIKNLKEKKYCKWGDMRPKDVEYFKNWTVLDFQECVNHGITVKTNTKN